MKPESPGSIPGERLTEWVKKTTAADFNARIEAEPGLLRLRDSDSEAFTLIHHAAALGRHDLVRLMLNLGVSIDEPSGHPDPLDDIDTSNPRCDPGYTPLMCAARHGQLAAVRYLVAAGADPAGTDYYRATALHSGAAGGSVPIVNVLLAAGCDPEAKCDYKANCEELGFYWVGTPLHVAALGDDEGVCAALIGHGAFVDASAPLDGRRPLHYAAAKGAKEALAVLLRQGADPTRPELFHGQTPLHYAADGGHVECVELLLQHGADPNARLRDTDHTPIELARMFYIQERAEAVCRLLTARPRDRRPRPHR